MGTDYDGCDNIRSVPCPSLGPSGFVRRALAMRDFMSYGWGNQWGKGGYDQWGKGAYDSWGKGGYGQWGGMPMGGYMSMGYGMDPMAMGMPKGGSKGSAYHQLSRGKACVEFASAEEATKAISTLNGTSLDGRQIKVTEWVGGQSPLSKRGDDKCKVYVANLNWKTQGWKLKEHAETAGKVVYAKVIMDKDPNAEMMSKMSKGYGKGWGGGYW
ncbi:unnamed protein product [Symbiodinium pilosum]|uniref:RRM domain-containing protein n=1 Tax=Symbiodinium pilosum TaxID=2952 RepID=A0A812NM76_SYMPI|nr:unnamed protein product [Symbiodinium pilosum]